MYLCDPLLIPSFVFCKYKNIYMYLCLLMVKQLPMSSVDNCGIIKDMLLLSKEITYLPSQYSSPPNQVSFFLFFVFDPEDED